MMTPEQLREMRGLLIAEQNKRKAALAAEDRARRQQETTTLARELGLRESEGWRFQPDAATARVWLRHSELLGAALLEKEGNHLRLAESGFMLTPDTLYLVVETMDRPSARARK